MATRTIEVRILGDNQADKALKSLHDNLGKVSQSGTATARTMDSLGDSSQKAAGGLGAALKGLMPLIGPAALVGIGAGILKLAGDFDSAYDKIRTGTGATGAALEGLKGDLKGVFADIPTDLGSASTAISSLNTRLGLTGEPLQALAKQLLELSRLTGTDVGQNVQLATRLFGDWGVATEDQSKTLDLLFRASQATGIGIGDLQAKVVQFGAPLRAMGFSISESVTMLGKWEKEGVNTELVLGSLRIAMGEFARSNTPMRQGLEDTARKIKELGPSAAATSLAMEVFGARAGPDMAAAILEGRFAYEELLQTIEGGKDTILGVAKDTMDFGEKFDMLKNRVMLAVEPLAIGMMDALTRFADFLLDRVVPAISAVVEWLGPKLTSAWATAQPVFDALGQFAAVAWDTVGGLAGRLGDFTDSLGGVELKGNAAAAALAGIASALIAMAAAAFAKKMHKKRK